MRALLFFLFLITLTSGVCTLEDPLDPERDFEYGDPKKKKKDDLPKTRDFKRCKENDQNCIEYEFFSYQKLMFDELNTTQKLRRVNKFLKSKYSGWVSNNKEYTLKLDSEGVKNKL